MNDVETSNVEKEEEFIEKWLAREEQLKAPI